jgi:hypothetical protein
MQNKNKITSEKISLEIIDGVLHANYHPCKINLKEAKKITQERLCYLDGASYPAIITSDGIIEISREARVFFSSHDGIVGLTSATFVYGNSIPSRILSFFILKMHPPSIPSKAFQSKKKALLWLNKYKSH